jgi:hypothetical protein
LPEAAQAIAQGDSEASVFWLAVIWQLSPGRTITI